MFPDSEIAKKFQQRKCRTSFGSVEMAPCFQCEPVSQVKNCEYFVLSFEESLHKVTQHGQMTVHIHFFDNSYGQVSTQYLGSQFLGHATADDLVEKFGEASKDLSCWNLR